MHRPRSVLCAFGCAFTAAAIDLPVAADAVVRTTLPAANFDALPQLQADPTSRALLKFDLSSLPASLNAASLVRASLTLYASRVITPGSVTILGNSSPWREATVTNNTQPGGAGTLTSFDVSEAGKFYTIDVTSAVASWLATPEFSAYGISLVSPSAIFIDSKKNTAASHAPTLTLIFSRPQGPQGPQGIRGVPGVTGAPGPKGDPGPASLLNLVTTIQQTLDLPSSTSARYTQQCPTAFPRLLGRGCGQAARGLDNFAVTFTGPAPLSPYGTYQCIVTNKTGSTQTVTVLVTCAK